MRMFPDTITRKRTAPGSYDGTGKYIDGAIAANDLPANVQPVSLEDIPGEGGERTSHRLKVFVPQAGALRAANDEGVADRVVVDGDEYVVVDSESWRNHHTVAVLLRET